MKTEYNYQSFTPEEVEHGLHLEFLNTLLNYNKVSKDHYNDIHLTTDGYCTIIEWETIPYNHEYGGSFKYVGEDEVIMLERHFPDNHTELCYDEEDYKERLDEFLKENPGWVKTSCGTWTNEIENEKFRKQLEGENNEHEI